MFTRKEKLIADAKGIIELAKKEDRDLTDEELAQVKQITVEVEKIDQIAEASDQVTAMIEGLKVDEPAQDEAPAKSLGDWFVKHAGMRLKDRTPGLTVATPAFKAATDTQVEGTWASALLQTVDKELVTGYRRPLVSDLFSTGSLAGTSITYYVEGAREGNVSTVGEAATKPQLHYADPTPVTETVKEIAGWISVSDLMIDDLDFIVSEINSRLLYDLALFEEQQLLTGDGSGTNLKGLLERDGIQTLAATSATLADQLFAARTNVQTATGLAADGILVNPTDYQTLRLAKDGNGQYFGGGYFGGAYGQNGLIEEPPIWGLRTVVSPAVAQGTVVVGAFKQGATVYRKGGINVLSTNSNADDFVKDKVTIRATERLAFVVRRPAAFVNITVS